MKNTIKYVVRCSISNVSLYDLCAVIIFNGADSRLAPIQYYKVTPYFIGWAQPYYFAYFFIETAMMTKGVMMTGLELVTFAFTFYFQLYNVIVLVGCDWWNFAYMPEQLSGIVFLI